MNLWQSFLKISLWVASIGLMVASSGMDGAYLAKLMPDRWTWLGLVLNTVADVTSELGMYWYGRLQMDASSTKRKRAKWILVGQVVLVGYAWLFGWRQLVPIIAKVDPTAPWMAWVGAAFIPAALIVVGYTQSLLAGRIEVAKADTGTPTETPKLADAPKVTPVEQEPVPELTPEERRERVTELWRANPMLTQAQVAETVGATRSTIGNDYRTLAEAGVLRRNGHGVEVN